ncbi:MAG: hypothetical protein OEO79_03875 [Gemmatimonadota bacterium]|nr:hypothetical protein [Gemmatimonadota bacterium]MDH3421679.1 hypothetical protein [Gemmatimonadota bacterium]
MTGADALSASLVEAAGGHVRAVLLYGSQLLQTRPDRHSAFDFVVVVTDYRDFYADLRASGELHRPVWLMTRMAGVLAPNAIAFAPHDGEAGIAKCQIVSVEDFQRALGAEPPDHFLLGRLVQRVAVVWSASDGDAAWAQDQLRGARERVLDWMLPYLEAPVDAEGLGRRLLEVCYGGEFRPEAKDRSVRIFEAQADHFAEVFPPVLERGFEAGLLVRRGDRFAPAAPTEPELARRWRRHFRRSKARATARWFKHMVTFANWLPYIVRKVERHTGRTIRLTRIERALPLVFLWPRAIYVLLTRPHREIGS